MIRKKTRKPTEEIHNSKKKDGEESRETCLRLAFTTEFELL